MKKSFALIFVFWIGLAALPGCNSCVCPKATYADIIGLRSFINAKNPTTTVNVDEPVRWDVIDYFALSYDIRAYSHRNRPGWGMAVYACDCVPPGSLGSTETLTNLTVKTVFAFDDTHPAGSVLNELVAVADAQSTLISLNNFLAKRPISYQDMIRFNRLTVAKTPVQEGPFALDITATLDNGETYTARTVTIQLL